MVVTALEPCSTFVIVFGDKGLEDDYVVTVDGPEDGGPPKAKPSRDSSGSKAVSLELYVGKKATIGGAQEIASYSVGAKDCVDIAFTPDESKFVLEGLRPCVTSILMSRKDGSSVTYEVAVYARAPQ